MIAIVPAVRRVRTAAVRLRWRVWLQFAAGAGVIALLLVRFGAGPFLDALRQVGPWSLLAAAGVVAGSTACSAYRWCAVSAGLGVRIGFAQAVPAYYRSQLLNATLPGGVLGDVHRGLQQHWDGRPLGRSLRAVGWERALGQAVQVLLAGAVLLSCPSPLRAAMPPAAIAAAAAALGSAAILMIAVRTRSVRRRRPAGRGTNTIASDWRCLRQTRRAVPVVALTSAGAVAGHVIIFLIAAHSIAPDLPVASLLPASLVTLVIGALPLNLAGWGPREGAAAWTFGLAGMGAAQGLSISVLFGLLSLLGTLPGAALLLAKHRRSHRTPAGPGRSDAADPPADQAP